MATYFNLVVLIGLLYLPAVIGVFSQDSPEPCREEGQVEIRETGHCAKRYRRCENGFWINAMCVGGIIHGTSHTCRPFDADCISDKTELLSRAKRQAEAARDCDRTFACPGNVIESFVYPDWKNTNCDTFITCLKGKTMLESCKEYGLNYYNPRRLSCESGPTLSNMCVHRLATDLSLV